MAKVAVAEKLRSQQPNSRHRRVSSIATKYCLHRSCALSREVKANLFHYLDDFLRLMIDFCNNTSIL